MVKVSVIVPVYNSERYLKQCLDSILRQTLVDIEVICVNDGSTDSSLKIMRLYEADDDRVIVLDKKNTGYGDSLNQGIYLAKGEYIAVVESDDFIDADMLEILYVTAREKNVQIVRSNYYEYRSDCGSVFRELVPGIAYDTLFKPCEEEKCFTGEIYLWTSIYKRNFIRENNILFNNTPGASFQDVSFSFKSLACADSVISLKNAFYHYRLDNPNSSVRSKEKVYCICDEFDEIDKFCSDRLDIHDRMKNIIPYMLFKRYMGTYWRIDRKFKDIFLIRLKHDLSRYSEEEINRIIWSCEDWDFYQHIKEKCVDACLQKKLYEMVNPAIIEYLQCRDVYIYGAGQVGKKVWNWLTSFEIYAKCFLVTSSEVSEDDGLPVKNFFDAKYDISDEDCILVAVGDKLQGELVTFLLEQGKTNVIPMNREMCQILEIV